MLVVLALALARPLSTGVHGAGQGDAVDAVLLFDTSMSMGASDGAMDRLGRAREAVKYLQSHFDSGQHFYYGQYYAAHAMHQVGGQDWEKWYGRLVRFFLPQQQGDGSWSRTRYSEVGPIYQTSIACIILSVPAHYLPIFQR